MIRKNQKVTLIAASSSKIGFSRTYDITLGVILWAKLIQAEKRPGTTYAYGCLTSGHWLSVRSNLTKHAQMI